MNKKQDLFRFFNFTPQNWKSFLNDLKSEGIYLKYNMSGPPIEPHERKKFKEIYNRYSDKKIESDSNG